MLKLPKSVAAWGGPEFESTLKAEVQSLRVDDLPLQAGMSGSSYAMDGAIQAMVIHVADYGRCIQAKLGIFYGGVTAGCNCADDPSPVVPEPEYCVVALRIDKATGEADATLAPD